MTNVKGDKLGQTFLVNHNVCMCIVWESWRRESYGAWRSLNMVAILMTIVHGTSIMIIFVGIVSNIFKNGYWGKCFECNKEGFVVEWTSYGKHYLNGETWAQVVKSYVISCNQYQSDGLVLYFRLNWFTMWARFERSSRNVELIESQLFTQWQHFNIL